MKGWAWCLILLSLCGKFAKNFLPKGEKSPLYAPLRFLLSLCLVIVIFTPFIKIMGNEKDLSATFKKQQETALDGDREILEQMGKTMKKSVDTAFPQCTYTLEIYADDAGLPDLIKVVCENPADGKQIADFIYKNYGLKTSSE